MRSLDNIRADVSKTRARIDGLTDRLKKLEQEQKEAENAEIINAVRGGRMNEREFSALLKRFRHEGTNTRQEVQSQ